MYTLCPAGADQGFHACGGGGRTFLSIFLLGCLEPIKLKDNERLLSILHPPNISDSLPHFAAH